MAIEYPTDTPTKRCSANLYRGLSLYKKENIVNRYERSDLCGVIPASVVLENVCAYEILKEKTRGKVLNKEKLYQIIDDLPISKTDKEYLKIKDLKEYSGYAKKLAEMAIKDNLPR